MKILTLNWGGPGTGSNNRIINDIETSLQAHEVSFLHVCESGGKSDNKYKYLSGWFLFRLYYVWNHMTGRRYETGAIPFYRFKKIVRGYKPDVVHIHCPNNHSLDLIRTFKFLGHMRLPVVITNHAEFFYTGSCPHAKECEQFIEGCITCEDFKNQCNSWLVDRSHKNYLHMKEALHSITNIEMVGVSPWMIDRMNMSSISRNLRKRVIQNGVDTSVFKYVNNQDNVIACSGAKLKVIHVTSHFSLNEHDLKGGRYVQRIASSFNSKDVEIFVVGNIELSDIEKENLPSNIVLVGYTDGANELADLYSSADLCLISSKRETFGMSCAESLCCGTPVIGFKNGGSDSIALEEYSRFYEYGDTASIIEYIGQFQKLMENEKKTLSQKAALVYSKDVMAEQYYELYKEMLS